MSISQDVLRRIALVAYERDMGFVELVGLADLDPAVAFRRASLRGVSMRGQDLSGFDFTGARMEECDIRAADLSRTLGVTRGMFESCIRDAKTRIPRAWFWAGGRPPSWADDWGTDKQGPWVVFRLPGVEIGQRLRWCPAGQFMMGSSADGTFAYSHEYPRHRVTFRDGFWMFETACTELFWSKVMGEIPAPYRGWAYPATGVTWYGAREFARRLNAMLPGLSLGLPSEAQWEYACRAGTDSPHSFGDDITQQQVRFGHAPSAGPTAVGSLPPNSWGLREMQGNTFEWCEDQWHDTYLNAPHDGVAWVNIPSCSTDRVMRGGHWMFHASGVRSAVRDHHIPSDPSPYIGFRCARVQHEHRESELDAAAPAKEYRAVHAAEVGPTPP